MAAKKGRIRNRQRMRTSYRMVLVVSASVFLLASVVSLVVIYMGDVRESSAFVSGDYRVTDSGNWEDNATWEVFDGTDWKPADRPPLEGIPSVVISAGQKMVLSDEVVLNQLIVEKGAQLIIESNQVKMVKKGGKGGVLCEGELQMGSAVIDGEGDFQTGPDAILMIGAAEGVHKKEMQGNIQLKGKRELHKDATYIFNGSVKQHSGNGLPSQIKKLVVDNRSGVELDQSLVVSHQLELHSGILWVQGNNVLQLGSSATQIAEVNFNQGALCGRTNIWYGAAQPEKALLPLSDGTERVLYHFISDVKAWQRGMIELSYGSGLPDDSKKSPFEARQVVIGITERGFFNANMSNGADEAWLKFGNTSISPEGHRTTQINISTREQALMASGSGGARVLSFSNMLYGPQPFHSFIVFRFFSESPSTSYVQLINPSGRMVFNRKTEVVNGYNQVNLEVDSSLPAGDYVLQISNANEIQTMKVVRGGS